MNYTNKDKVKSSAAEVKSILLQKADPNKAKNLSRFFKTGKGDYGEGDQFLGIQVPVIREIAKSNTDMTLTEVGKLIKDPYHEVRLTGLLILTYIYPKASPLDKKKIYKLYLLNKEYINNWDLVDLTADKIVGTYLYGKNTSILESLARSGNVWDCRISMLANFYGIKKGNPGDALRIAEILVNDKHDLIHKAVGWMLREIGKRCGEEVEDDFLEKHYQTMPRTMLRYAIERMDEKKRDYYLGRKIIKNNYGK